jgi:aminoglycoside phosphotransferase (APT) family kinase protein
VRNAVGPAAGAAESYRPALSELERAVRAGLRRDDVAVVTREHPRSRGSYPSEVVTCRLEGSRELRLYCKYGHPPRGQGAHGHRRGVGYEAEVYREVLEPLPLPTAGFHGSYTDRRGATWLLLDHIEDAVRLHRTPLSGAMVDAARWLGRFHAASEIRADDAAIGFLKRYDADYYRGWVRRTRRFGADWQPRLTWLEGLCARFEELLEELLEAPQTTVHGEYYPNNILWREGLVYPLDWETAAIGPGELDLAMLTEGWSIEVAGRCELAYRDARWPDGAPPAFERALTIARSYAQFRWLGDNWNWTIYSRESPSRFERLRLEGELLGAI